MKFDSFMSIPLENQKYPRAINHILKKVGVSEPSFEAYMYQKLDSFLSRKILIYCELSTYRTRSIRV